MRTAEQWLEEYARTHQNPANQRIHLIAVPLIFWSVIAALATLPPVFLMLLTPALTFYFALGWAIGLVMVLIVGFSLMLSYVLMIWGVPLFYVALTVFFLAWIAQFYGHKLEGKRPAFFLDLLFLLVGPLWTLQKIGMLKNNAPLV